MRHPPPAPILERLLRRAAPLPDPADLGTAFGLDASLQPAPQPPPPVAAPPTWLERLRLRF